MIPEPNQDTEPRADALARPTPDTVEPSLASLVGGILNDVQTLMGQHLDFLLNEIREDFRKTQQAAQVMGLAVGVGAVGAAVLVAMLIGLLTWAVPAVPWWGWCGVVGTVLLVAASLLYYLGRKMFTSFNPLPDRSADAVKESLGWTKDKVDSNPK